MFTKIKTVRNSVSNRVSAVRCEIGSRISEVKNKINNYLTVLFPPERRRLMASVFWVTGKFFWEFFSILWGVAKWFGNLLLRIATFWQVVFWNRRYKDIFVDGGLFSILAALFIAPEFLLILFLLVIIPLFFAWLCMIAAKAVLEFIYLFFKFMPPMILVPVVAAPLGIVAALAALRTVRAWKKRKGVVSEKNRINTCSVSCN